MIYVTGDTHGDANKINNLGIQLELTENDYLIIAGDFGFIFNNTAQEKLVLDQLASKTFKILFVDGNHECFPEIYKYPTTEWNGGKIHIIRDNIYHLTRGQVFVIEGKKIFTFGGAFSIDHLAKKQIGRHWNEEIPTKAEMDEGKSNLHKHGYTVDYIITHTIPTSVKRLMGYETDNQNDLEFTDFLDEVRINTTYQKWYAGHFHKNTYANASDNIIILYEGTALLI